MKRLLITVLLTACTAPAPHSDEGKPSPVTLAAPPLLAEVNAARAQPQTCGAVVMPAVPPLTADDALMRAAQGHADDMQRRGYVAHASPEGEMFWTRTTRAGYTGHPLAENIANGTPDAPFTVQAWLASPGHCLNLMHPDATRFGGGQSGRLWVAVFGN